MATKMVIEFGLVTIPIKMELAVELEKSDAPTRHKCCQHDDGTLHRTEQWNACKDCANRKTGRGLYTDTAERRNLVWGVDDDGVLKPAGDDEGEAGRSFKVGKFVDLNTFDPMQYGKPYWLTPDTDAASNAGTAWAALVAALDKAGLVAEVAYVMRKGGVLHPAILRARDGRLALQNLVNLRAAPTVKQVEVDDRLLRLMLNMIELESETEAEAEVADLTVRLKAAAKKPRRRIRKTA
jgi:non-homologous end joining protein Ku